MSVPQIMVVCCVLCLQSPTQRFEEENGANHYFLLQKQEDSKMTNERTQALDLPYKPTFNSSAVNLTHQSQYNQSRAHAVNTY